MSHAPCRRSCLADVRTYVPQAQQRAQQCLVRAQPRAQGTVRRAQTEAPAGRRGSLRARRGRLLPRRLRSVLRHLTRAAGAWATPTRALRCPTQCCPTRCCLAKCCVARPCGCARPRAARWVQQRHICSVRQRRRYAAAAALCHLSTRVHAAWQRLLPPYQTDCRSVRCRCVRQALLDLLLEAQSVGASHTVAGMQVV